MANKLAVNQKLFDNSFDRMLFSLASGETKQLEKALNIFGFNSFGMEIPIAYGLAVTFYAPYVVEQWCEDDKERFICEKLIRIGGSIPLRISWLGLNIADCLLYFNNEIGIAAIFKPIIDGLIELNKRGTDSGDGATKWFNTVAGLQHNKLVKRFGKGNYKEFYKMQEVIANKIETEFCIKFIPVLWYDMDDSFNTWYYSGALRRGSRD